MAVAARTVAAGLSTALAATAATVHERVKMTHWC